MERAELERRRINREKRRKAQQRQDALIRSLGLAVVLALAVALVLVVRTLFTNANANTEADADAVTASAVQQVESTPKPEIQAADAVVSRSGSSISSLPQPATPDPESIIYFTFDDGPSTEVTPKLLDLLEENEVPATFFILNYSEELLPILRREVADGHTIAMHAWDHDYAKCYTEDDAYLSGIEQLREKVFQDTGYTSYCLRFPGGSSNTVSRKYNSGIMTRLTQQVDADPSWEYFDWNVDSTDATGNNLDPEKLAQSAINSLKKGQHNVILCHDTNNKTTTVEAVEKIIEYARANGYCFSAIQRDTPPVHHGVNN